MQWWPTVSAAVENFAVPPLTGDVPRIVEPSRKVTVPVGIPEALGVTVAENVTVCPKVEGFDEDVIVVEVGKTEIFRRTVTPPTARSGLPSRLKSPTAMPRPPAPNTIGVWNVPLPLPSSRKLPPKATSSLPSPSKSATASDRTPPSGVGVEVMTAAWKVPSPLPSNTPEQMQADRLKSKPQRLNEPARNALL